MLTKKYSVPTALLFFLISGCSTVEKYKESDCNPQNVGMNICNFNESFVPFEELLQRVRKVSHPVFIPDGRPVQGTYRTTTISDEKQKVIMAYQACGCNVTFNPALSEQEADDHWAKLQAIGRSK